MPWQTILAVLGGILLLLLLVLLFGRAKIRIVYRDKPTVILSILGFRKTLFPSKEKEEKKGLDVSTDPQKILAEEMRIARIKRKKLRLAKEKKEKKARKKAVSANPTGAVAENPNLLENLSCVFAVIRDVNYRTNGKLYFRVNRFRITVATDDAAKTALLYGAVVQSAAYVFQWIETHFNHLHRKNGAMEILPDYTAQKSSAELDFSCSLTFLRALIIYLCAMGTYETKKSEVLAKRKNKTTLGNRLSKLIKKA